MAKAFVRRGFVAHQTLEAVLGLLSAQPRFCSINGFCTQQISVSDGTWRLHWSLLIHNVDYRTPFPPKPMFIELIANPSDSYHSYNMASDICNNHDPDPITDYNPT